MPRNPDAEDSLETAALRLFADLGYEVINAYDEVVGENSILGRANRGQVVLTKYLYPALEQLNPDLPPAAIEAAVADLLEDRSVMTMTAANQEIYGRLKYGVKVTYRDVDGVQTSDRVQVIDWVTPANNHFLAVQQLWVTGKIYTRRPDVVCLVNGLPLVFIELKAHHQNIKDAFRNNLRDYKTTIPQIFRYNGFIILSNGSDSLIGSITAGLDHFATWKKIDDENEAGLISLETMIRGTCEPSRLLDLVENFTLFDESKGSLAKLVGKNHQYLGVNKAVAAVGNIERNEGKLGVFWHTQGSGKSYSMVFFTQKVIRTLLGNWTFVIVTDRTDLDEQIYKNFANVGVVTELPEQVRAGNGEHLKQLLREDHTYVFTLIQKFHSRDGEVYPVLSERDDIIVVTDEAHRSQYDTFAANMRRALPNAAFIGFTGTPLMAGEEKTRQVFGDYVSIYNFKQSVDDEATVPLWYENRVPELELANEHLNEEMEQLLEAAELDEAQEAKLERIFAAEYHLITREDRLEAVAQDIVEHYVVRGFQGRDYHSKAMVVSIDRMTAVRMYDKVQAHWQDKLKALRRDRARSKDEAERAVLDAQIEFLETTDMAVVVSQAQNEVEDFDAHGLDIRPHRKRMVREDLETAFKEAENRFRMVFVCAMWMTGFDAPACSTIYLDKPMKNHTLMQTIARANRVFQTKPNGIIVDYIGVFRNLQRALAIYGQPIAGDTGGQLPAATKDALIEDLRELIGEADKFCQGLGIQLRVIEAARDFARIRLMDEAVEDILVDDETKQHFIELTRLMVKTFKSILPDSRAIEFEGISRVLQTIAAKIHQLNPEVDISEIMDEIEALLDASVTSQGYVISTEEGIHLVNLSQVDFEALREQFNSGKRNTSVEQLRAVINRQLMHMIQLNPSRLDYQQQLQEMIDDYNSGARNTEQFFEQLMVLAGELTAEEQRHIAEQLSEEELAIFDLLTRPRIDLTAKDKDKIKAAVRDMLDTLKAEKLVLDWRKRQQSQAEVRLLIEKQLDEVLPQDVFDTELYREKCDVVYQHIYDKYAGAGQSVYN